MKTEIRSFLWVASAYDHHGQPAYQVDVVETAETMAEVEAIGGLTRVRPGLNVTQALALGLDLTAISQTLNIEAMAAREAAEAQVRALTERLAALAPGDAAP